MTTRSLDLLVLDDGASVRGYDCRDVVRVEEIPAEPGAQGGYLVRLGRMGPVREVLCRNVLGSVAITAREIRPVPEVLRERMAGEKPWAVGITERGICLLY